MAARQTDVLTSWKEIARYVGKGVRTVQRWEACFGFPVRRPRGRGLVAAYPGEIDAWLRSSYNRELPPSNRELVKEIAELRAENNRLRQELDEALQQDRLQSPERSLLEQKSRCEKALRINREQRQRYSELTGNLMATCQNLQQAGTAASPQCAQVGRSRHLRTTRARHVAAPN